MKKPKILIPFAIAILIIIVYSIQILFPEKHTRDYATVDSPDGKYTIHVYIEVWRGNDGIYDESLVGKLYFNTEDREPEEVYWISYWEEVENAINVEWIDNTTFKIGNLQESVLDYVSLQKKDFPPVDFTIPNGPVPGAEMATDGKKLYGFDIDCNLCSYNPDGTAMKQIIKSPKGIDGPLPYHELSYSNGWLYYMENDTIYRVKTDGTKKIKLYEEKNLLYKNDFYRIKKSLVIGDSLYYLQENKSKTILYCVDSSGRKLITTDLSSASTQIIAYQGCLYYFNNDELLTKHDPTNEKKENVVNFRMKSILAIVNGTVYYLDDKNHVCEYNLQKKEKKTLSQNINGEVQSVVQWHNFLIIDVGIKVNISELVCFDTITKKGYRVERTPMESYIFLEAHPVNDGIYLKYCSSVSKLYFEDGKVIIKPLEIPVAY